VINVDAALSFLNFVEQRHQVWERRSAGLPQETWTDDPIVATRKFTNVYRVLDYGSQFVLTDLLDPELDPRDQLLRLFLYRHTGRVEAWKALEMTSGYPTRANLDDVIAVWKTYRGDAKPNWSGSTTPGGEGSWGRLFKNRIFTSAYMVFPQTTVKGTDKLDSVIELTRGLFVDGRVGEDFLAATSQSERFAVLRRNKGVADFMSYQILTDWGYTPHCGEDRENEFVVCGPGSRKGAALLDLSVKPEQMVHWACETLQSSGTVRLEGRLPTYVDCQNLFCEYFKYNRSTTTTTTKPAPAKPYTPAHPGLREYVLPPHWTN